MKCSLLSTFGLAVFFHCHILSLSTAQAHEIPRQRVDRSIQLIFSPGLLKVQYRLELDDITVAGDLKKIADLRDLPADPDVWLDQYGQLVAPKLIPALLVYPPVGNPFTNWQILQIRRLREIHPVYEFTFTLDLNETGEYRFKDTNFGTSEGLSRLGVRSVSPCQLKSTESYPEVVDDEDYRPVWMLDTKELEKTRSWSGTVIWNPEQVKSNQPDQDSSLHFGKANEPDQFKASRKLENGGIPSRFTVIGAFLLGFWHSMTPGHGKSLITLMSARSQVSTLSGIRLLSGWMISHFAVILSLAGLTFLLPLRFVQSFSAALINLASLLIALPASYRLGADIRLTINSAEMASQSNSQTSETISHSVFQTGLTAGIIPCWEAIGLTLIGLSSGNSILTLELVLSFICGSMTLMILLVILSGYIQQKITMSTKTRYYFFTTVDLLLVLAGLRMLFWPG